MKKVLIILSLILIICIKAYAVPVYLSEAATEITDGSFDYRNGISAEHSKRAAEALKPQNILIYMLDGVKEILSGSCTGLALMLAVVFIASFTEIFSKNLGSAYVISDFISLLTLMLLCLDMITPLLLSVTGFLDKHTSFMTAMTSTSAVLLSASGSAGSAAVSSVSASFITAFTQICSVNIILPAVKVIIVLSSVGAISKSLDLSGIISFLKSFCLYGTGLLFAVFLSVHALTLDIASGSDSLIFKSLRFTAARLIPIAGGMISESIKTVLAGMNVIKKSAGGIGIAYIIYTAIPAVISVLSVKTAIVITLAVSRLFSVRKHAHFLDGLNGACNLLLSICIFAAFSGIIILAVFMKTTLNM